MQSLYYDFHIHSCLSPCGDDDMTPGNLVAMAKIKGLDVIALTDHNSCLNCPAALHHGEQHDIIVIPGMELCTSEEVHVVCLFPDLSSALAFDKYVYERLLPIENNEQIFGKQQILDKDDNQIGSARNLLINATDISFDDAFHLVESFGGVAFPAHINKSSTSLLSNLGFIPPDSVFKSAEVKNMEDLHELQQNHPYLLECNILFNSDAHYLENINEPIHTLLTQSSSIADILQTIRCKI
jgi:PHP family Zn ribbon phosphoesterase